MLVLSLLAEFIEDELLVELHRDSSFRREREPVISSPSTLFYARALHRRLAAPAAGAGAAR
jgi:hypothetical protein